MRDDKAEAMAAYARKAKDSELIQYATEIKVHAARRCMAGSWAVGGSPGEPAQWATGMPPPPLRVMTTADCRAMLPRPRREAAGHTMTD